MGSHPIGNGSVLSGLAMVVLVIGGVVIYRACNPDKFRETNWWIEGDRMLVIEERRSAEGGSYRRDNARTELLDLATGKTLVTKDLSPSRPHCTRAANNRMWCVTTARWRVFDDQPVAILVDRSTLEVVADDSVIDARCHDQKSRVQSVEISQGKRLNVSCETGVQYSLGADLAVGEFDKSPAPPAKPEEPWPDGFESSEKFPHGQYIHVGDDAVVVYGKSEFKAAKLSVARVGLDGTQRWKVELDELASAEASPRFHRDLVLVVTRYRVLAFAAATGKIRWIHEF